MYWETARRFGVATRFLPEDMVPDTCTGIAVLAMTLPMVGLSTFLHKTSFSRRPTKARQNIYRASIANNNTNFDVLVLTNQASARNPYSVLDLP